MNDLEKITFMELNLFVSSILENRGKKEQAMKDDNLIKLYEMRLKEIQNEMQNQEAEIKTIQTNIEELKKPKINPLRVSCGERFYWIDPELHIYSALECNDSTDDLLFNTNNYFKTKEEAEQEARLRKFENEVATYIKVLDGKTTVPDGKKNCYSMNIDLTKDRVEYFPFRTCNFGQRGWWSDSKETIEKTIKHFGEDKFVAWFKGTL